jgi:hypothetical protein
MDDSIFKLRITAYSPDTIPMNRLAEYMLQIAALMGGEYRVHFKGLKKGSTVLCVKVEQEDVPKVNERLARANRPDAPADVVRPFKALNDLLRADNARATLKHGTAQIIKFPGCDTPLIRRIGPVKEAGQLEGVVISVGGKDNTKHIRMIGHDDEEYKLTTRSLELAKDLGNNLFSPVRVTGLGTWYRNENGQWDLDGFIVQSCEPLEDTSLIEAVAGLRDISGDEWKSLPDPLKTWRELRRN